MSEIENLLNELKNMKDSDRAQYMLNNRDTWSKIAHKDLASLGLTTEEELKEWIANNPYSNLS